MKQLEALYLLHINEDLSTAICLFFSITLCFLYKKKEKRKLLTNGNYTAWLVGTFWLDINAHKRVVGRNKQEDEYSRIICTSKHSEVPLTKSSSTGIGSFLQLLLKTSVDAILHVLVLLLQLI